MARSTISSRIDHAVTLGSPAYLSPLLITAAGTLDAGAYAAAALYIPPSPGLARVTNGGTVLGAPGPGGATGGAGILVEAGALIHNAGSIIGGSGGAGTLITYGSVSSGAGGTGIAITSTALLSNAGLIAGGAGGATTGAYESGAGGIGLADTGGRFRNSGTITGGIGGTGGIGVDITGPGAVGRNTGAILGGGVHAIEGAGGVGLYAADAARVINSGLISGGTDAAGAVILGATVVNDGVLEAGPTGGIGTRPGATGVDFLGGQLLNNGAIYGDAGGFGRAPGGPLGGDGGNGIDIGGAGFTNRGSIAGGAGGLTASGFQYGAQGGDGASATTGFLNTGAITGGAGSNGVIGGIGGNGVAFTQGALANSGSITGGAGGTSGGVFLRAPRGGQGGTGVTDSGALLRNTGSIFGGAGGYGGSYGGNGGTGGDGVYLASGTLINAGTIGGGAGGAGTSPAQNGQAGDAVRLGTQAGTLVVASGAVFNGIVAGNAAAADVLAVAGKSGGTLAGIGTSFTGFASIAFASDGPWTISGDISGLATGEEITGFRAGDAITLTDAAAASGTVSVATAGVVTIDAGGTSYTLDITGATVGERNFSFSDDTLTKSGRDAMAFLTPSLSFESIGGSFALPGLGAAFASAAETARFLLGTAPAPSPDITALNTPVVFGAAPEFRAPPPSGLLPAVTLQV